MIELDYINTVLIICVKYGIIKLDKISKEFTIRCEWRKDELVDFSMLHCCKHKTLSDSIDS